MDLIELFANIVAAKVAAHLNGKKTLTGRKLDMKCRVPRCKRRSRGPRFRYICKFHGAYLTESQQRKALDTYARKADGG